MNRSSRVSAVTVVVAFYEALGRADGTTAASYVIAGKRASGPFSADAITHFYSQLLKPLRLVSVSELDSQTVLARYNYRTSRGHACSGRAVVHLRPEEGTLLIDGIRALNNC